MFIFQLALKFNRTTRTQAIAPSIAADPVLLFDGRCDLCARSVRFILRHEAAPRLRFTSLQSRAGVRLLREHRLEADKAETFVLIAQGRPHVKSDAALQITTYLRGAWRLLGLLKIIPRPIRDWAYDRIARNRYRWFGRFEACPLPDPELKSRFFEE